METGGWILGLERAQPDLASVPAIGRGTSALAGGPREVKGQRPEIAVSWWRSQLWGVDPAVPVDAVPTRPLFDGNERLRLAVQPVLDDLAGKFSGLNVAVILTDQRAVVLDRRGTTPAMVAELDRLAIWSGSAFSEAEVGTNAVGTAAEERRLVRVASTEHYAEILKHLLVAIGLSWFQNGVTKWTMKLSGSEAWLSTATATNSCSTSSLV